MLQCATNAGKKEENQKGNDIRGKRTWHIWRCILTSLFVLFFFCCMSLYIFYVSLKSTNISLELGDEISEDIHDYLLGKDIALNYAKLDTTYVNKNSPGEYTLYIYYFWHTFEVLLNISDTTAPEVNFFDKQLVCKLNSELTLDDSLYECVDKSPVKATFLNTENDESIYISDDKGSAIFSECGVHPVSVMFTDTSGNYTSVFQSVIVDTAPVIYGALDYYVSVGTPIDIMDNIWAQDDMDGDISSKVQGRVSADYLNKEGDYPVNYTAVDSLGLVGNAQGLIHTYDSLFLQDMVNTKKINPQKENVKGVLNPYDSGYITEADCEKAIENAKPAVVRVHYETEYSRTHGSGYIVKITDYDIIVCTNKHVVGNRNSVTVSLFDGSNIEGYVVNRQTAPDIAFIRLSTSDVDENVLSMLKTIHINLNYYKSLSMQPRFEMGMYCIEEDGSEWLTRYGNIVRKSGVLDEYFVNYDYPVTEVSVKLTPGVSGSAIIDAHGNLLCMATFYWDNYGNIEYYGVSLDDILDFYEETFGERLEYY